MSKLKKFSVSMDIPSYEQLIRIKEERKALSLSQVVRESVWLLSQKIFQENVNKYTARCKNERADERV